MCRGGEIALEMERAKRGRRGIDEWVRAEGHWLRPNVARGTHLGRLFLHIWRDAKYSSVRKRKKAADCREEWEEKARSHSQQLDQWRDEWNCSSTIECELNCALCAPRTSSPCPFEGIQNCLAWSLKGVIANKAWIGYSHRHKMV
jgi:hypothetical protein